MLKRFKDLTVFDDIWFIAQTEIIRGKIKEIQPPNTKRAIYFHVDWSDGFKSVVTIENYNLDFCKVGRIASNKIEAYKVLSKEFFVENDHFRKDKRMRLHNM